MKRLFFSLRLAPSQQQLLQAPQQQTLACCDSAAVVPVANLHLTLFFLGLVSAEQEEVLVTQAKQWVITPFTLKLDYFGYFSKPKIVYIAPTVVPAPLLALQQRVAALCEQAGFQTQHPEFKPHITLLRHAKPKATLPSVMPPLPLEINAFTLYHSTRLNEQLVYLPLF